jgi:hypothetical protein
MFKNKIISIFKKQGLKLVLDLVIDMLIDYRKTLADNSNDSHLKSNPNQNIQNHV